MGSIQKLATVVMIGLVALATVTLIHVANEPNRRDTEVTSQDDLAIERGTQLYITYCLQCHAPGGEGAAEGTSRIGGVLNQAKLGDTSKLPIVFQLDDPSMQSKAEHYIRYRITNGFPGDPRLPLVMPAFGPELNVEEMNDLVYLVMHADWNYVYNQAVTTTGTNLKALECTATPTADICTTPNPAVYPTVPPTAVPTAEAGASPAEATPAASGSAAPASGASQTIELDAQDISWSKKEITAKPGDTIVVKNVGALPHDFSVDAFNIADPIDSGASVTVTIPADAKPGSYEYYCSVPGHKEAGMVGTLTIAP
ncbi:MAG: plastocyanin/azurin family copper-binding protein [Thermomicrobiales bacterium]